MASGLNRCLLRMVTHFGCKRGDAFMYAVLSVWFVFPSGGKQFPGLILHDVAGRKQKVILHELAEYQNVLSRRFKQGKGSH